VQWGIKTAPNPREQAKRKLTGGLMLNILIAEGTPAVWQTERTGFGLPSNFSLLASAVQLHQPGSRCTPLNIADGEALPFGIPLSDFDGDVPWLTAPYL
jgi:hypothetical protein